MFQALHVMFTLFAAFKNSEHFAQYGEESEIQTDKQFTKIFIQNTNDHHFLLTNNKFRFKEKLICQILL